MQLAATNRKERKQSPSSITRENGVPVIDALSYVISNAQGRRRTALVLCMVGLPARGKTSIARKLSRYLTWRGLATRVFNIGNYRRKICGAVQPASFFDPDNEEGVTQRRLCAAACLKDMAQWLAWSKEARVAIYDGTNSTHDRRDFVRQQLRRLEESQEGPDRVRFEIMWIESVCHDQSIIEQTIRMTKLHSPDYKGMDPAEAVADFRRRIANYEKAYQTLGPADAKDSYIKLIDVGTQIHTNRVRGWLQLQIQTFLSSVSVTTVPIFLTRHGESLFNVEGRIGGDSSLSPRGQRYARKLGLWMSQQPEAADPDEITVWCSTLRRTLQTATPLSRLSSRPVVRWRTLSEIDAGVCDGLTYEQVQQQMPDEWEARAENKLEYRYPSGESYTDLIDRLTPVTLELERARGPIVVVAHRAILRCLYAYFTGRDRSEVPHLPIPLHTCIKLTARTYQTLEERFHFDVDAALDSDPQLCDSNELVKDVRRFLVNPVTPAGTPTVSDVEEDMLIWDDSDNIVSDLSQPPIMRVSSKPSGARDDLSVPVSVQRSTSDQHRRSTSTDLLPLKRAASAAGALSLQDL